MIPENWAETTLEKVATWGSGGTPSRRTPEYFQGEIPWVKTGELVSKYIFDTEEKITEKAIANSSAKIFPTGSIGIAMYGATIGKLSIWGMDASTNQACAVGLPIQELLDKEFLYYYLASQKGKLIKAGKGGAQPNISQGILKSWPIFLPPLNEQRRIVAKIERLFGELDAGVASLELAQAQLKTYRQALLKHAFEGKLTAQWRKENGDKLETADTLLQRIQVERQARQEEKMAAWQAQVKTWEANGKPSKKPRKPRPLKTLPPLTPQERADLPELPAGWAWIRLGNVINEPNYGTSKKCDYETSGIGVLRIPNVVSGTIVAQDLKFAEFDDDEIEKYRLAKGDLLIIRSNGSISIVGQCALVTKPEEKYLYAGYLIRLRPHLDSIDSAFLLNNLTRHASRQQIEAKAKSTSGVNNINSGEIQSLIISVCNLNEQKVIRGKLDAKLSIVDQLEQTITTTLQQAKALRQSILKKAFAGQLVPQDPTDEPASVLLARIRATKP
ncbi:Type I restriction-modification system, specificity subunit S [hydrothermal vent metagenome]|uniref:Type I restriction-modification system, specificity subunit S n=1 Tax=hydrothermal vent metagenome TaxID=652676 RepID=A0A3B0V1I7_9ZZZZ